MKAQILKIAGVKSEKEFYKKFPSEEAFMKKHGKEFKKAQVGALIGGGDRMSNPKMVNLQKMYDEADMDVTGMTDEMRQKQAAAQAAAQTPAAAPASGGGIGSMISSLSGILGKGGGEGGEAAGGGGAEGIMSMLDDARYGADIPRAQKGETISLSDEEVQNEGGQYDGYAFQGGPNTGGKQAPSGMEGVMSGIAKYAGPAGKLYEGYEALRGERRARKAAEQQKAVSDITLKASQTKPEQIQRKYVRPEDIKNTGEEFFPIYGVGTNPLARNGIRLQDGGPVGGNPTEIQNTYAPNTLFDNLGYEPLTNPNQVKSFYHGGKLHQMKDGGGTPWEAIGSIGSGIAGLVTDNNAGSNIGGTIGGTAGMLIGGPAGQAIGQTLGTLAGGLLDTNTKATKRAQAATKKNIQTMALNSGFQGVQSQNQSYMEDGGWVSHDWQPQVITTFGEHKLSDLLRPPHDADMLRAGGHLQSYTPPSERALQTYEEGGEVKSYGLGGELQTHWGGGAETISRNPYLPGTGETVMFRGKSHEEYSPNGETGIGVTYGGNPVEVERGEPMVELEEGGVIDPSTGEVQKSGVVFGNLQIPNQYLDLLGDKSAKGKKFKNYVNDLSKGEEKQNKIVEKSTNELNDLDPITPFDQLKLATLNANIQGANMKLKGYADKKINAAALQNAINDTAEEHGIVADDLARGKVKIDKEAMKEYAEFGTSIPSAQAGKKMTKAEAIAKGYEIDPKTGKGRKQTKVAVAPTEKTVVTPGKEGTPGVAGKPGKKYVPNENAWWRSLTPAQKAAHNAKVRKMIATDPAYKDVPAVAEVAATPETKEVIKTPGAPAEYEEIETEEPKAKFPWQAYANQLIDYLRPSDQEALDMEQLYPEMYALSSNQLEPVPAQFYQPDLGVPYDISFQDQLNANQADYRAAQRMVGYNPAAQANLNAQKYQANQGVLGEQFRANQAMKDKVYSENRNILNQAKLTNLGIADRQYERQSQALSNTKATTQAALNSIADKYAKNKLENRTLGVYENLYKYRYDDKGRLINMNPLAEFNTTVGGATSKSAKSLPGYKATSYDKYGNVLTWKKESDKEDDTSDSELEAVGGIKGKNGSSIKKNQKNSSIVKAIKNL